MIYRFYRKKADTLECGFSIETTRSLSQTDLQKITWLITETFEPDMTRTEPHFTYVNVVEIGPRLTIETPFSSNAVSMCHAMGIDHVVRIETTDRYLVCDSLNAQTILATYLDKMTQQRYPKGILDFNTGIRPAEVKVIDLIGKGKTLLSEQNKSLGLGMDESDIDYYYRLFVDGLRRNPTDVELFQLGNANSEHSRHWYFKGKIVIDGVPMDRTLFEIVQAPLKQSARHRSLVAFKDNAGVIQGFETQLILPVTPGTSSELKRAKRIVHITCTAETHNHPTSVSPYEGAMTGPGGEIRDDSAVGRGGICGIGIGGYFVGNLFIPDYEIPGEVTGRGKLSKYASPLRILIEGSNGVSDYNNQYGRPVTAGFCRSFGQMFDEQWREPRKAILYTAGVGHVFGGQTEKESPQIGMHIVRIGGPAYPIGVGGGSASSMMQGQNTETLDFSSVQRGNPEMENRTNRVIRACAEMGDTNPISSIHDQGAGGPSNVLTELLEPLGGTIDIRSIVLGDKTMSVLQIWSAEFQEGYGLLIRPENLELFQSVCARERVSCEVLGVINGSGNVVVSDSLTGETPVNLNLEQVLTHMPQKTFETTRKTPNLVPLELPDLSIAEALKLVLMLPHVGSKGFLVHKADRSVTGLVAQQQCCGIAQIPIANVSLNAQSHFGLTGSASAIGEQPIKMLIDPKAGARMSVGEMLTNIASVSIGSFKNISSRANWIWPAKMPHQGALLYDAASAMSDLMIALGIGDADLSVTIDGGKDSLSPVATVGNEQVISPGSLVMCGYAAVPDITKKVTPDIKRPGSSILALIDLGQGKNRLGGSALAQAHNQLGDESPDVDDPLLLKNAFLAVQQLIEEGLILAMHDRSDGGLITAVIEMCMASRCGFALDIEGSQDVLAFLFNEELGFVLELDPAHNGRIKEVCSSFGISISKIGTTSASADCSVTHDNVRQWHSLIQTLRTAWESTSSRLEEIQTEESCAKEEHGGHGAFLPSVAVKSPSSHLTFTPVKTDEAILDSDENPRVAILREEGSNGDREVSAACLAAGLRPFDVSMQDLLAGTATLDDYQGLVFAPGFSYKDVLGSAKGWAGVIKFNDTVRAMFDRFYERPDTFSLGICNGCQLMALLGWVPWKGIADEKQPRFIHNNSGRFESRWTQVEILPSPSIMLKNMEGSKLGVWSAHGEGKLYYPDHATEQEVKDRGLAPMAFIDYLGRRTETYPANPNGSPGGITALCSPDGRHLAMMPHPDRTFISWQWPWMPQSWKSLEASSWLQMFQNARAWCLTK